jgi:glycogen operon protein
LRRHDFLRGERINASAGKDVTWLRPDGTEMQRADWDSSRRAALAFRLDGGAFESEGAPPLRDDSLLVLMNGEPGSTTFILPAAALGPAWYVVLDTRERSHVGDVALSSATIELDAGSLVILGDAPESLTQ